MNVRPFCLHAVEIGLASNPHVIRVEGDAIRIIDVLDGTLAEIARRGVMAIPIYFDAPEC